jgi:hypothetical protein
MTDRNEQHQGGNRGQNKGGQGGNSPGQGKQGQSGKNQGMQSQGRQNQDIDTDDEDLEGSGGPQGGRNRRSEDRAGNR